MPETPQPTSAPTITLPSDWTDSGIRTLPDFAQLYPTSRPELPDSLDELTDDDFVPVTAREAYLLYAATDLLADQIDDAAEDLLPPPAVAAAADDTWRGRFIDEVRLIGRQLATGQAPFPTNTAQEMILHLLVSFAEDWIDTLELAPDAETAYFHQLSDADSEQLCLSEVIDGLVDDIDVLMLFDMPQLAVSGSILAPDNWFRSFRAAA